jgi:hypothetical protein|tara:strand:+ start:3512 stop:4183 length:672 start_codon:yes stop_codon:yes gene_type:complete
MKMSKIEPHPTDKGKYQSTLDKYGHGKGKGKSKTAIYKHHSKKKKEVEEKATENSDENEDMTPEWENLNWLHPDEENEIPSSLPKAVQGIVGGSEYGPAQRATQRQLVIWSYMGIDRLFTHWGQGVTQDKKWQITRSSNDYMIMEQATTNMMDAHGIRISMSPTLVWGTVMAGAYGPPVVEVVKKADPLRRKGILNRLKRVFRRKKKFVPPIKEGEENGEHIP